MKTYILLLTLVTCSKLAKCNENISSLYNFSTNRNYSTVQCINNILTRYFPCGTLATFVNPNANFDELIRIANKENICHSIIVRSFDDRDWFIWTNVYVITAETIFKFWTGMLDLTRDVFWNPRAKFVIQIDNLVDEGALRTMFKILVTYRMFNVVVIKPLKEDAVIYTYHPFDNNGCGRRLEKVITLGTCENSEDITSFFPYEIPVQMKNCTFKVVATDDVPNFISTSSNYTVYGKYVAGLEQYVLDTIADREEFSLDYEVFGDNLTYGVVLPNRTATGLLKFIDTDKADVAAGGFILMQNRVELFDYIWGFNYAAYYLYTPAMSSKVWQRAYREFGTTTWSLIAATIIFVIIVGEILSRMIYDNTFSILNLWGYFFGNAGRGLSTHRKFRTIIIMWALFTFYISNFYNAALLSLITVHIHERPHSLSVNNLRTLPYKPCISDNTRLFYEYAYNHTLPINSAYNCSSTDNALHYVATTKKYYAIEMDYSYKLKEYQYINSMGKPELDSWIFSNTHVIVMYLVRGFPFIEKFQDYAHRFYEAGLIQKHMTTINLRSFSVIQRQPKPFTMTSLLDLRVHFCILLAGYGLSFLCLLLEIWYNYIKMEKKVKRTVKIKFLH
ncbi:hypothetical protein SFRURICE_017547 [Spodoptera frugiperda]|uniref:SFRICE005571.2 n=1 Tax=Spodoptera frugiperda TaxID=7108 RepID=A0A2H1WDJ2_SPOFR|nr:hypothetical protein SFRURICE_017547 [Spodoptera frugiperda]